MYGKNRPPSGLKRSSAYPKSRAYYKPRGIENRNQNPPVGFSFLPPNNRQIDSVGNLRNKSSTQADSSTNENLSKAAASVSSFQALNGSEKAQSSPQPSITSSQNCAFSDEKISMDTEERSSLQLGQRFIFGD